MSYLTGLSVIIFGIVIFLVIFQLYTKRDFRYVNALFIIGSLTACAIVTIGIQMTINQSTTNLKQSMASDGCSLTTLERTVTKTELVLSGKVLVPFEKDVKEYQWDCPTGLTWKEFNQLN